MFKKGFMAVMVAASLIVSSSAVAFAAEAETIEGPGWWVEGRVNSTGVPIADGESVTFEIVMDEPVSADDTYAAFCVEASDGTNFFTTTSAGDCWGYPGDPAIGNVLKDTGKNDAVRGGSYEVTMTRDGNDFTATYVDKATGEPMFSTLYFMAAEGTVFADPTTVYVMGQVGNGKVTVVEAAAEEATDDAAADTAASTDVPKTGVGSSALIFGLGALATGAVALKRKEK